jgi:hypothetical protein
VLATSVTDPTERSADDLSICPRQLRTSPGHPRRARRGCHLGAGLGCDEELDDEAYYAQRDLALDQADLLVDALMDEHGGDGVTMLALIAISTLRFVCGGDLDRVQAALTDQMTNYESWFAVMKDRDDEHR